ncbi:MAG: hypothetical protein GXO36_05970 [Chloroflexi bacterium]|nr:hypothetical protein [Chloroflexota bacterium]
MPPVVAVRFRPVSPTYDYDATAVPDIAVGDFVVVPTPRGEQVGEVVRVYPEPPGQGPWEAVLRRASARDLALRQARQAKEVELLVNLRGRRKKLAERYPALRKVKIVEAELSLDDRHLTVLYTTGEDEDANAMKELRKAGQRVAGRRKVHWQRIGPRDAAKLMGGMGACGMAQRCCNMFFVSFETVSIKMGKIQNVSLTPSDVMGMCGRLRCCLRFEVDQYAAARQGLPKQRQVIHTPEGQGKVVDLNLLAGMVTVDIPDKGRFTFHRDELIPLNPHAGWATNPCEGCPYREDDAPIPSSSPTET